MQAIENKHNLVLDILIRKRNIVPVKVKLPTLKCGKCGHEWYPRNPRPPKVCPICKRTDWQTFGGSDSKAAD